MAAEAILLDNMSRRRCAPSGRALFAARLCTRRTTHSGGMLRRNSPGERSSLCRDRSGFYFGGTADAFAACGRYEHAGGSRLSERLSFGSNSRIISASPKSGITRKRNLRGRKRRQRIAAQPTDVRLGRIVRLLMEHATVVVSGTKIAQEISSNRSEVWRLIQQLRGLGVDVAGHPATGYQLRSVPDLLLPEILRPLVRGTIFGEQSSSFLQNRVDQYGGDGSRGGGRSARAASFWPKNRRRDADAARTPGSRRVRLEFIVRWCCVPPLPPSDVLVLSLAAGLAVRAAIQQVDPRVHAGSEMAQRCADRRQKSLRDSHGDECRGHARALHRRGHRHQRESGEFSDGVAGDFAATRDGKRVVASGTGGALLKSLDREYRQLLESPEARQSILRRFAESSSWVRGKTVRIEENGSALREPRKDWMRAAFCRCERQKGLRTVLSGTGRDGNWSSGRRSCDRTRFAQRADLRRTAARMAAIRNHASCH